MPTTTTPPDQSATPTAADSIDDPIDDLRAQIDALDARIAQSVAERAAVSKQIQALRINSGGTRFELSRERVVLDHYRAELGHDGPGLAESILRICRGTR